MQSSYNIEIRNRCKFLCFVYKILTYVYKYPNQMANAIRLGCLFRTLYAYMLGGCLGCFIPLQWVVVTFGSLPLVDPSHLGSACQLSQGRAFSFICGAYACVCHIKDFLGGSESIKIHRLMVGRCEWFSGR